MSSPDRTSKDPADLQEANRELHERRAWRRWGVAVDRHGGHGRGASGQNGRRWVPLLPDQLRQVECRGQQAPLPRWERRIIGARGSADGSGLPNRSGERWRGLVTAPECRCTPYDRDDYDYPQSVEAQLAERLDGAWSPYDGTRFESLKESDIEHVVAVSEAHDSGLCGASLAVRARFARDLDNLTLATPRLNRHEKVARDAAEWLPELNRCWFAKTVIAVRQEYGLTIDRREADALDAILAGCE